MPPAIPKALQAASCKKLAECGKAITGKAHVVRSVSAIGKAAITKRQAGTASSSKRYEVRQHMLRRHYAKKIAARRFCGWAAKRQAANNNWQGGNSKWQAVLSKIKSDKPNESRRLVASNKSKA